MELDGGAVVVGAVVVLGDALPDPVADAPAVGDSVSRLPLPHAVVSKATKTTNRTNGRRRTGSDSHTAEGRS